MVHNKIYKNDSEYVIANVMDDVENVDAREYLINFHAKSIYPAIKAMVQQEKALDETCKDPNVIMLASKKMAENEIAHAASLEIPENVKSLFLKELSKKEQISLLKGISITIEQLAAFFYMPMITDTSLAVTDLRIRQKNMLEQTYQVSFIYVRIIPLNIMETHL